MSRSNYCDDGEDGTLWLWRRAVNNAIHGRRGQAFLRELLAALDALPEKKLIADDLEHNGAVCAIGSVGKVRGLDMSKLDPEDSRGVADVFGIAEAMAREIVFVNDEEGPYSETPEARFARVRRWVDCRIDVLTAEYGRPIAR